MTNLIFVTLFLALSNLDLAVPSFSFFLSSQPCSNNVKVSVSKEEENQNFTKHHYCPLLLIAVLPKFISNQKNSILQKANLVFCYLVSCSEYSWSCCSFSLFLFVIWALQRHRQSFCFKRRRKLELCKEPLLEALVLCSTAKIDQNQINGKPNICYLVSCPEYSWACCSIILFLFVVWALQRQRQSFRFHRRRKPELCKAPLLHALAPCSTAKVHQHPKSFATPTRYVLVTAPQLLFPLSYIASTITANAIFVTILLALVTKSKF